jgi:hypothetical protein
MPQRGSLEERLADSLRDPRWRFRTLAGLSRDLGVSPGETERLLGQRPDVARRSVMTSSEGAMLYTAAERRVTVREWLERLRWLLAR